MNVDITDNTIDSGADIGTGIDIKGNDTADVNFNIFRNIVHSRNGAAINISSFLDSEVMGRINSNSDLTVAGIGSAVRVLAQETSHTIVEIKDNNMTMAALNNSSAVDLIARFQNARLDVTLDNNNINSEPSAVADINLQSGSSASGETNQIYADIKNNDVIAGGPTNVLRLRVSDLDGTSDPRIFLTGFVEGGAGIEDDAVATWNAKANTPAVATATVNVSLTGTAVAPSAGTALTPTNPLPSTLLAASGGVQAASPTAGETHLSQAQLDSVIAAAMAQWEAAGATPAQLATLAATTLTFGNLSGSTIGLHVGSVIVMDTDAAGHGWFVDSTPTDSVEFAHASGNVLTADPSSAAAGHLDLLTAVMHEMGHQLGLPHSDEVGNVMFDELVDGVRRLPDDLVNTNVAQAQAQAPLLPVIRGTAGNDVLDGGLGGKILVGEAGADHFVFANLPAPTTPTHVADYSFIQGDSFDFSALTSAFHGSGMSDGQIVRAVEDASGSFATLQVNTANASWGTKAGPVWTSVAQIDGAHAGADVSVLIDGHALHMAHLHVGLLV